MARSQVPFLTSGTAISVVGRTAGNESCQSAQGQNRGVASSIYSGPAVNRQSVVHRRRRSCVRRTDGDSCAWQEPTGRLRVRHLGAANPCLIEDGGRDGSTEVSSPRVPPEVRRQVDGDDTFEVRDLVLEQQRQAFRRGFKGVEGPLRLDVHLGGRLV